MNENNTAPWLYWLISGTARNTVAVSVSAAGDNPRVAASEASNRFSVIEKDWALIAFEKKNEESRKMAVESTLRSEKAGKEILNIVKSCDSSGG
ncbi:hypothetical protein [Microbulbifer sp.]|uniref:hypothetical protein n=1 Tax=Microbulbifer sp. TaxID=1908541 RepID=UPI00258BEA5D|nr:hypothetical protein [Microbulbifer sp.]